MLCMGWSWGKAPGDVLEEKDQEGLWGSDSTPGARVECGFSPAPSMGWQPRKLWDSGLLSLSSCSCCQPALGLWASHSQGSDLWQGFWTVECCKKYKTVPYSLLPSGFPPSNLCNCPYFAGFLGCCKDKAYQPLASSGPILFSGLVAPRGRRPCSGSPRFGCGYLLSCSFLPGWGLIGCGCCCHGSFMPSTSIDRSYMFSLSLIPGK